MKAPATPPVRCPHCGSNHVHRSRRHGIREGWLLRRHGQAPYRCSACKHRFIGAAPETPTSHGGQHLGLADYLGIRRQDRPLVGLFWLLLGSVLLLGLLFVPAIIDAWQAP